MNPKVEIRGELYIISYVSTDLKSKITDIIDAYYMDLQLDGHSIIYTADSGTESDEFDLVNQVELLIAQVKKDFPGFILQGYIEFREETKYGKFTPRFWQLAVVKNIVEMYEGRIEYEYVHSLSFEKLKQAREKIKEIMARPSDMIPADPPPRYDDIFFEGVEAMEKDQDIDMSFEKNVEEILARHPFLRGSDTNVSSTKYLLSMDEFHLCDEAVIELYKRGSKFIEVDFETMKEMEEFTEQLNKAEYSDGNTTLQDTINYHRLVLYNGHLLSYNSNKLESRCCPILFKLIDEWGLKGIAGDEKDEQTFGIVEIPNNLKIEMREYERGNYIVEKYRSWCMKEKK